MACPTLIAAQQGHAAGGPQAARPPHVPVEREDKACKFLLEPIGLVRSHEFDARELSRIRRPAPRNQEEPSHANLCRLPPVRNLRPIRPR
jgi:hypothetical protein